MNKLWIFGDNNSAIFGRTKERRFKYYKEYRNDKFPKSWSELLAKELNLELKNLAIKGQSNYDIFDMFSNCVRDIKKDDIVIIGWSFLERFRLADNFTNAFTTIRPNQFSSTDVNLTNYLNGININTIEQILLNRSNTIWKNEIYIWENLINYISLCIGFKVYYWTFDSNLQQKYYIGGEFTNLRNHLISIGAEDITSETRGNLKDLHFGEIGQIVQFNYFLNNIN